MNKRNILLLASFLALALAACGEKEDPTFNINIDGAPIEQGQVFNMQVGDSFKVGSFVGEEKAESGEYEWSSSDETVAQVTFWGEVTALHGGQSTIKVSYKDTTISFAVSIPVVEHGDLYYYFDASYYDETGAGIKKEFHYVNGVLQDEPCNILDADEQGNLYQGYMSEGKLNLRRNGVEVAHDKPVAGDKAKFMAKNGKAYLITNEWEEFLHPGVRSHCYVLSADGAWRDIDLDVTNNQFSSPAGYIVTVDEDSEGNIILWGNVTQGDHWWVSYLHIWRIDAAGNIQCTSGYYHDPDKDWDLGGVVDVALDADGNMVYLESNTSDYRIWECGKPDDEFFSIPWGHTGKYAYTITEKSGSVNGGRTCKMIVRGNDVWVAASEIVREGKNWADIDYALNIYKNGSRFLAAAKANYPEVLGGMDCCITPSGDIYTIHTNVAALFIKKNGQLILYRPYDNANAPSLAVKE